MVARCGTCGGRKKLLGMGGMMKPCTDCNETGFEVEKPKLNVVLKTDPLLMDRRSKAYRDLNKKGA